MAIDWGSVIKLAAPAISSMAQAATSNRSEKNTNNIITARDAEQAALDRARLALDQSRHGLDQTQDARTAESDAANKAIRSALLMNMQDASFDRSGFKTPVANVSFSGGLRPSALGAEGLEAAKLLNNSAMKDLMAGKSAPTSGGAAIPRDSGSGAPAYEAPQQEGAGFWERALGVAGLGATVAGEVLPQVLGKVGGNSVRDSVAEVAKKMAPGAAAKVGSNFAADSVANVASKVAGNSGMWSTANSIAGPAGMGLGIASQFLPAGKARTAADWASKGAQIGSFIPGVGTVIGMGVGALAGAIKGHQNATVGDREDLAKTLGYRSLDDLYKALETSGPQGLALRDAGLNKIGKHDEEENAQWVADVSQLLGRR
jgi:hypothetical protein